MEDLSDRLATGRIQSVNSIKPSLEDAFIKITGLSPIVMAIEKGGRKQYVV